MHLRFEQVERLAFSPNQQVRKLFLGGVLLLGALAIAFFIGIAGPTIALAARSCDGRIARGTVRGYGEAGRGRGQWGKERPLW